MREIELVDDVLRRNGLAAMVKLANGGAEARITLSDPGKEGCSACLLFANANDATEASEWCDGLDSLSELLIAVTDAAFELRRAQPLSSAQRSRTAD